MSFFTNKITGIREKIAKGCSTTVDELPLLVIPSRSPVDLWDVFPLDLSIGSDQFIFDNWSCTLAV